MSSGSPWRDVAFQRTLIIGLAIRCALFAVPAIPAGLTERPEVSTPAASWKRLREGVFLLEHGLDPYEGDMFQQSPLLLALFSLIPASHETATAVVFTLADTVAAWLLWNIAKTRSVAKGAQTQPWVVAAVFFLHPFSVAACLGRSSSIFSTVLVLSSTLLASRGHGAPAAFNLALASHLSLYPILLLPPVLMLALQSAGQLKWTSVGPSLVFCFFFITDAFLCRSVIGSWSFLRALRSVLSVSDLTPNVGLSWYLFIEMFDHFRNFFIGAFHLHVISYVAPICIKLRHAPLFAVVVIGGIIAVFRSYPSVSDVSLLHALICLYPELLQHLRHPLFSTMTLVYSTCLLPAFHHLWLYAGSGNANFYYASTLVWSIANGALVIDYLYAHLKRDFLLSATGSGEASKDIVVIQE